MNPVTRIRNPNGSQQSIRSTILGLLVIFFSVASIFFSRDAVKNYSYVFQNSGMNIYGYYGADGVSKVSKAAGSSIDTEISMPMKSDDDDDDDNNNLVDMFDDGPSGIIDAEHEDDDDGGDNVRENHDHYIDGNSQEENTDDGDVPDGDDDAVNNDDDVDNDDYRGDMSYTTKDGRKRMNVLILYPDDWRHNSIGKENPIIQTPFLDSLADDGIRFRQNAVTTSICWQSRATLFSGQWASRHQSYKLKCPHFAKGQLWNQTWPKLLQDDDYFVGHVGKWQYYSDNTGRFSWTSYHEGKHWYGRFGRGLVAADDVAKEDAIRFLNERPKDKPFAMTVAFYPPKPVGDSKEPGGQWRPKNETRALYENITIPEPYNMTHAFSLLPDFLQKDRSASVQRAKERYYTEFHYQEAMKNVYALITQVDQACKDIVDEVKKQGLYNNTMIIFSTDNGMFNGAHGLAGKWYPYQESIRVPLIIHDPRMPADKVGSVDDNFTLNVDLAETILGAAGLKPHERMQGRDISDLYLPNQSEDGGKTSLEKTPWRDEFFYEFTFGDETFIPSSNALVRKKWKYIDWYGHNHEQLFDLEEDPLEFTDVKDRAENAEILSEMRSRLAMYKEQLTEPNATKLECERGDYSINPLIMTDDDDGMYLAS